MKNNKLSLSDKKQLCKLHNGKNKKTQKVKLSMYKSYNYEKIHSPLKKKKTRLHRLKFIQKLADISFNETIKCLDTKGTRLLSKRYTTDFQKTTNTVWNNEKDVINWLLSVNVKIRRVSAYKFLLEDKICSLNHVLIFANKKRIELGLDPFYMEGITEF